MIMKDMLSKIGYVLMACMFFALPSCVEEEEVMHFNRASSIKVIGRIKDFNAIDVASRGGKDTPETKISNMCLFIFDNDGTCINVQFISGSHPTFIVDRDELAAFTSNGLSTAKMYILANVAKSEIEGWGFTWTDSSSTLSKPSNALNLTDFLQQACAVNASIQIPADGFPMLGFIEQNLTPGGSIGDMLEIPLDNLYAKIVFTIKVKTNQSLGGTPQFELRTWDVFNLPKQVRIGQVAVNENVTETPYAVVNNCHSFTDLRQGAGFAKGADELTFTFYMPEHMVMTGTATLPPDIGENEKQRYKPKYVLDGRYPTYVRLNGVFTDHQGHVTDLSYDVYLGSNNSTNFQVERNCQYNNNITITGITNHNHKDDGLSDGVISVDHRVNINSKGYSYAIEQEASLDAHWNVIPMDLYVEAGKTVEVSLDKETCNWIRMEKIFSSDMNDGTLTVSSKIDGAYDGTQNKHALSASTNTIVGSGYQAYHGIRNHFTTNLVTETLVNNTSYICSNRDRIYFYVDENISLSSRQATISLVYRGDGTQNKNITFKQSGLKEVIVYNRDSNGNLTTENERIYIEDKEEYLYHYDPLNKYDASQVYEGLPWGGSSEVGNYNTDANTYYNGRTLTKGILDNNVASLGYNATSTIKEKPLTAAEYCNNKGKRNPSDNKTYTSVSDDNGVWFLPAIREMEAIMRTWYSTYEDFQENFYWSSAPAKTKGGFLNLATVEDTSNARATRVKVTFSSGDPVYNYYESGSTNSDDNYNSSVNYDYFVPNGTYSNYNETNGGYKSSKFRGGRAPRGNKYRVRAAYVPPTGYTVTASGLVKQ